MRRTLISLNLYGCQDVQHRLNLLRKMFFFIVFAVNWAYVGQPDNHIGGEKSMPFKSIDPTHPRTNLCNFGRNCSAFGGGWKSQFFWVGHFVFFFSKKKKNASSLLKSVIIYWIPRMGQHFDDNLDFQQKARVYKIMRNTVSRPNKYYFLRGHYFSQLSQKILTPHCTVVYRGLGLIDATSV